MPEPAVYDIRKATLKINGVIIEGIGEDGYGITPSGETTLITGLFGENGFNVDPSTGAEATVNLQSTSPSNEMLTLLKKVQDAGTQQPFTFEIIVDYEFVEAFGFKSQIINYCLIVGWPEHESSKESNQYEWKFIGYGYERQPI